ncbi:MAG: hypothetical protein KKB34_09605 [Bacteroidetes bacterium]|nr:hypothetical protein [Bacteroidota bacterium]
MKKIKVKSYILIFLFIAAFLYNNSIAQSLSASAGADIVSRYIWRGIEVNNTPNIQPSLAISAVNFELGIWGSYTLSNQKFNTDEMDFYLGYNISTSSGDISLLVTDYYFPNSGVTIDDFDDGGGAHTLEFGVGYSGTESFPITVFVAYNFYNDPGNNIYTEVGYPFTLSEIDFRAFASATPGSKKNPIYYGTEEFKFTQLGLTASKEIKITEDFSLPLFSSFIINPNAKIAHMVFGTGFSL